MRILLCFRLPRKQLFTAAVTQVFKVVNKINIYCVFVLNLSLTSSCFVRAPLIDHNDFIYFTLISVSCEHYCVVR